MFRRRAGTRREPSNQLRRGIPRLSLTGSGWQVFLGLAAVIALAYAAGIRYPGFGPELAMFFKINSQRPLSVILSTYTEFQYIWYRPTALHFLYWLGGQLFGWDSVAAWKVFQLVFLLAACWMQYLFTLEFVGTWKLAAWISAIYLAVIPGQVSIILQTSAFDGPHLIFALLTTLIFARALRSTGTRMWLLSAASCLCYAIALTCKESTLVLPAFLLVLLVLRGPKRSWPILIPHALLLAAYIAAHVLQMPSRGSDDAYRTGFNLSFIVRNLWSFPLWTAHIYGGTAHPTQTLGYNTILNNAAGLAMLVVTVRYWVRERARRLSAILMLTWIAITLSIPIYSGAYLWHVNLAVCGYAVLAGAGIAAIVEQTALRVQWRPAWIGAGVTALLLALGAYAVDSTLSRGVHSMQYGLSAGLWSDSSRLPAVISKDTLIYVEDRLRAGKWSYGGNDYLLKFYYKDPQVEEKSVPPLAEVPWELRYEWLRRTNALFLRYDDQMRWYDGSKEFRSASIANLTQYTNQLINEQKWLHMIALLEACFREAEARNNPLLQYHYAFALHSCGRITDAINAYTRSIDLQPSYYYTLLGRGNAYRQNGDVASACADYRRARSAPGALPHVNDLLRQYCR